MSFVIAGFVIFSRILSMVPTARILKTGVRTGFLTAINLSQISEFSLVILALGAGYKHITPELQSLVLTSMLLMSVLSTYLIQFNDRLARWGLSLVSRIGLKDSENQETESESGGEVRDIVILGCFREGLALLDAIDKTAADIKPRVLVVDYNPAIRGQLEARGYKLAYGDLAHPQTLHHLGVEKASLIICTISDTFLKGITNRKLLSHLKNMAPAARFIMTADDPIEAGHLRSAGAHDTVLPSLLTGARMLQLIKSGSSA